MTNVKHSGSVLVPLTRVDQSTGLPYVRPDVVREQIERTLDLPLYQAFELARDGLLRPQTLVYLMRNFRPNSRSPGYDAMILAFYSRLERSGDSLTSGLTETQREWVEGEVVKKVSYAGIWVTP